MWIFSEVATLSQILIRKSGNLKCTGLKVFACQVPLCKCPHARLISRGSLTDFTCEYVFWIKQFTIHKNRMHTLINIYLNDLNIDLRLNETHFQQCNSWNPKTVTVKLFSLVVKQIKINLRSIWLFQWSNHDQTFQNTSRIVEFVRMTRETPGLRYWELIQNKTFILPYLNVLRVSLYAICLPKWSR